MQNNDSLDYIYSIIDKNKDKMKPSDYLYLLMKAKDIEDKIKKIKNRKNVHSGSRT